MENKYAEQIAEMRKSNMSWQEIADYFSHTEKKRWTVDQVRNKIRTNDLYDDVKGVSPNGQSEIDKKTYKDDGSITSHIRIRRESKKVFSKDELLELHGFNPNEFQLKQITSNEWTTPIANDTYYNYQSKIVAEPKKFEITAEYIAELFKNIQPKEFELCVEELPEQQLFIALPDMHFQLNTLDDYKKLRNDLSDIIINGYEEILFTLHGDYFHVDNFLNTTEKGTLVDEVDFCKGIEDGYNFLIPLLELALKHSPCVRLVYLKGNHAPSVDYMFVQGIKRLLPDLEVDDTTDEYKHVWLGKHSIFLHHGDKIKSFNRLLSVLVSEYAKEWGESQSRYLITGHYHHEKSLSNSGITHYQMMSPSKRTRYDRENGYTSSEDGLMVLEFDKVKRRAIYYL